MADDYSADASTTGRISVGGNATGTLEVAGDIDWFAVDLVAGLNYQFLVGADAPLNKSVYPAIVNSNGTTLKVNIFTSNGLTIHNPDVSYIPTSDGRYYVRIAGGPSGSYTIFSSPADDYKSNTSTTGVLSANGTATGTLEASGDRDWFAVSMKAGVSYSYTVVNQTASGAAVRLSVVNAVGTEIASSRIDAKTVTYTPSVAGTYFLQVWSTDGTATGRYAITPTGSASGGSGASANESVYRFFDSNSGTHFFTANTVERNTIIATRPDLINEGIGLSAANASSAGAAPVYRFFDTLHGTQFLTADAGERDNVQATRSDLTFEGTTFYEYKDAQTGRAPVYRFFDSVYGTHFFTGSEGERASILATRPDLIQEGVAFYSPT